MHSVKDEYACIVNESEINVTDEFYKLILFLNMAVTVLQLPFGTLVWITCVCWLASVTVMKAFVHFYASLFRSKIMQASEPYRF